MIFIHSVWESLCKNLDELGLHSVTAEAVLKGEKGEKYFVLKHDVETDVSKALKMAQIEASFGHRGSYYVQAYLLNDEKNVSLLKEIKELGHEISYHYDVMDFTKGDLEAAITEFEKNKKLFEGNGFTLSTLCQHGNPVVERIGYTSNRDFFISERVQSLYGKLCDIMVDFKQKANTEYIYFSDAGRRFNLIFDPINNDIIKSDDKNIPIDIMHTLVEYIGKGNCIVSVHPHRWEKTAFVYCLKRATFKAVKAAARFFMQIPVAKKIMSKYYYLAKKI